MCNVDCLWCVVDEWKWTCSCRMLSKSFRNEHGFITVIMNLFTWMHSLEVLNVMHFQSLKNPSDDIFEMSKRMLCLKHSCKRKKKMCVTVMLVLPVWTEVESKKNKKRWQVTFVYNLRQWLYKTNWPLWWPPLPQILGEAITTTKKIESNPVICINHTGYGGERLTCSENWACHYIRSTSMYVVRTNQLMEP